MNTTSYYINSWMFLGILASLVFLITAISFLINYLLTPKVKPKKTEIDNLDELISILQNPNLSADEYHIAADSFLKFFSDFPSKKDKNFRSKETQESVNKIFKLLEAFSARHESDEAALIELQKTLVNKNPDFKEEISKHINKSLKEKG